MICNVYYATNELFAELCLGYKRACERGHCVTIATLNQTHRLIMTKNLVDGLPTTEVLGLMFNFMQAEQWSPNGEASPILCQVGIGHTSMCVGDVIEVRGEFYFCDLSGWTKLE